VSLRVVPLSLADANAVVLALHRHHKPATGHRFSLGVIDDNGVIVGVAIIGRPVARMVDHLMVCEVSRVATDGTKNACSKLLGAAARAAQAMGYAKIQTYTLPVEGGASLRGSGWVSEGSAGGGQWVHTAGPRCQSQPTQIKTRWSRTFCDRRSYSLPEVATPKNLQGQLFGGRND